MLFRDFYVTITYNKNDDRFVPKNPQEILLSKL